MIRSIRWLIGKISAAILAVPIRAKITGIMLLPVLILGFSLNFWVTSGLSDWLSYILTDVRVEAAMEAGGRSTMLVTVLAALSSVLLSILLTDILTRPILQLKKTAENVAEGKYDTRAVVWANDEIGALAGSLNQMILNFDEFQQDLARRNDQLEALNRIALAADREAEIHDVLYIVLENLLRLLHLPAGWVYLYDPDLDRFHLASMNIHLQTLNPEILFSDAEGKLCRCQEALVANQLDTGVGVRECGRLRACGLPEAITNHLSIPIEARDKRFGVINLLQPQDYALSDDSRQWITSIAQQISEIVANAWLQMKLKEKEAARQFLLESLVNAQEEERSRLARELHDQVGQSMTSLLVRMKAWEKQCIDEEDKTQFNSLLDSTSDIIEDLRDISYSLHPPALEELGLAAALETLGGERAVEAGFALKADCEAIPMALSSEEELVLYRIAQEAFTNIMRHAQAATVDLKLARTGNQVLLVITDDGQGFDPAQVNVGPHERHLGLISMSERAELAGGRLDIYSAPGEGTTVQAILPIREIEVV